MTQRTVTGVSAVELPDQGRGPVRSDELDLLTVRGPQLVPLRGLQLAADDEPRRHHDEDPFGRRHRHALARTEPQ